MKKLFILLFALLSHTIKSSLLDIEKLCALPIELQQKIIKKSEIGTCFSLENTEYQNIFKFLSIDYYLTKPYRWTKSEFEHSIKFWQNDSKKQSRIKQEYSYLNISNLASWLDAAMHCFFYNEAMDLIVASECRKIRNGQTKIGNFNNLNFFEQLSFAKSTTYQSFNANIKKIFKEKFEERLRKYIPHIQPIPLPLPLQPLDRQFKIEEVTDTSITFKLFFYDCRKDKASRNITDYHFGLKGKNVANNCYINLNCNNYPSWFFIKQNLDYSKTTFRINTDNKTITDDQSIIHFLDINQLTTQQILCLQKMYFYVTYKKNISFERIYTDIFLFLPTILCYPLSSYFTPQYKLSREWETITHDEKAKEIGKNIINHAIQVPTILQILKYSPRLAYTYVQLIGLSFIMYSLYTIKQFIQYKTWTKKSIFILFTLYSLFSIILQILHDTGGGVEEPLQFPDTLNYITVKNT